MSKKITYAHYPKLRKRRVTKTFEQGFGQNGGVSSLGATFEDLDSDGVLDTVVRDSPRIKSFKRETGVVGRPYVLAPVPLGPVDNAPTSNFGISMSDSGDLTLSDYFTDADGDTFTYVVSSSDTDVATVSETGGVLTVTKGTTYGTATITVTGTANGKDTTSTFTFDNPYQNVSSILLDGTLDRVLLGTPLSLDGAKTVSLWVKSGTVMGASGATLLASTANNHYFPYVAYNTTLLASGLNSLGAWTYKGFTNLTFTEGQWYNIVISSDGTDMSYYVDNILAGTKTNVDPQSLDVIGGTSFAHNSNIDEVAIWQSALTASQVSNIWNDGVPGDLTALDPDHWWRMGDEIAGGVVKDITGGNDGTLVADAQVSNITP